MSRTHPADILAPTTAPEQQRLAPMLWPMLSPYRRREGLPRLSWAACDDNDTPQALPAVPLTTRVDRDQ